MKKQIYLHVPEPCHENWDAMTPVQQGRFCQSCCKQVTDFSLMSDKQILEVLSKAAGNTCGRFAEDQLQRPMVKEVPYNLKPYKFFLSAFIPAFLLANSSIAQTKLQGKVKATTEQKGCGLTTKGETVVRENITKGKPVLMVSERQLSGKVVDEQGNPLAEASVIVKGTRNGMSAREDGTFLINIHQKTSAVLLVSYVGYQTKEITAEELQKTPVITLTKEIRERGSILIPFKEARFFHEEGAPIKLKGKVVNEQGEGLPYASVTVANYGKSVASDALGNFELSITPKTSDAIISASHVGYTATKRTVGLTTHEAEDIIIKLPVQDSLQPVIVTAYSTIRCRRMWGAMSIVSKVNVIDTAKTFIAKVFKNEMYKVHPNPVTRGTSVNITFKEAGEYSMQLFDNSGKLYLTKELRATSPKSPMQLMLPPAMSSGNYYLKAINTKSKKQFIDKIIVQ